MVSFFHLLRHDLRLHICNGMEWAGLILFFMIVIILLPFALGPEPELLRRLAPGLIWLATLLMSLLSLDRLFIQDERDGTLDLMLMSPLQLPIIVLSKLIAQSVVMLAALLAMLLPASVLLDINLDVLPVLVLTLLIGVPVLVLLGGIMGAITVALKRNASLLMILLAPFYIPVLIFAMGACDAAAVGVSAQSNFLFLGAIFTILLSSAPFIIAATLRQG